MFQTVTTGRPVQALKWQHWRADNHLDAATGQITCIDSTDLYKRQLPERATQYLVYKLKKDSNGTVHYVTKLADAYKYQEIHFTPE